MSIADPAAPLDASERAAIAALAASYPTARAAALDALTYMQARRRYIADPVLAGIAAALGLSTAALDELATFYSLIFRRPVGETVLLLCDSVTCWMLGAPALETHIHTHLGIKRGETTADDRFTLLPVACLGHCDHAPALMLGERLLGDATVATLDAAFERAAR
jgi:NADH-quinone oxidoreductase subunit E